MGRRARVNARAVSRPAVPVSWSSPDAGQAAPSWANAIGTVAQMGLGPDARFVAVALVRSAMVRTIAPEECDRRAAISGPQRPGRCVWARKRAQSRAGGGASLSPN